MPSCGCLITPNPPLRHTRARVCVYDCEQIDEDTRRQLKEALNIAWPEESSVVSAQCSFAGAVMNLHKTLGHRLFAFDEPALWQRCIEVMPNGKNSNDPSNSGNGVVRGLWRRENIIRLFASAGSCMSVKNPQVTYLVGCQETAYRATLPPLMGGGMISRFLLTWADGMPRVRHWHHFADRDMGSHIYMVAADHCYLSMLKSIYHRAGLRSLLGADANGLSWSLTAETELFTFCSVRLVRVAHPFVCLRLSSLFGDRNGLCLRCGRWICRQTR